jgi:hypothetical protein
LADFGIFVVAGGAFEGGTEGRFSFLPGTRQGDGSLAHILVLRVG